MATKRKTTKTEPKKAPVITVKALERKGACQPAIDAFLETFPSGKATLNVANARKWRKKNGGAINNYAYWLLPKRLHNKFYKHQEQVYAKEERMDDEFLYSDETEAKVDNYLVKLASGK